MKFLRQILSIAVALIVLGTCQAASAEIVVIVNPENSANLTNDDIKRIFLGKLKTFPGGGQALPLNLGAGNATRVDFDAKALGKSASQIKAYWSKLVFSGKGNPPQEVENDQAVLKLIKENPALIGYIDAANATADVKVVAKF